MLLKLLFVFIFSLSSHSVEISLNPGEVKVDEISKKKWREDIFRHEELIAVGNREYLKERLEKKFGPLLTEKFLSLRAKELSMDSLGALYSLIKIPDQRKGEIFILSEAQKKEFPIELIKEVYRFALQTGSPSLYFSRPKEKMISEINKLEVSDSSRNLIKSYIINFGDEAYLPISPELWRIIPDLWKDEVINGKVRKTKTGKRPRALELRPEIEIKSYDDIQVVIDKYVIEDESGVKTKLEKLWKESNGKSLKIKLKDIVSPFVVENYGKFNLDGGPNCFNASLCVSDNQTPDFTSAYEFEKKLQLDYFPLDRNDSMEKGDILILRKANGEYVHAVRYIADDIVFTKNGATRFSSYIFQNLLDVEAYYGKRGSPLLRDVFRHRKKITPKGKSIVNMGACSKSLLKDLQK